MLKLDTVLKSLEIKLAGAVATTELPFICSWTDLDQLSFGVTAWSSFDGVTTGATAIAVSGAAVPADTTRQIQYLSVVNVDTAAVVLTIQLNNTGTKRPTETFTLAVGDNVSFTDAGGWVVMDLNGNRKSTMNIAPLTITNAMLAGSIAASKLVGSDIATVGTITSGVWNAGAVTSSGTIIGVAGVFSGLLSVTGFGVHSFAGNSSGGNILNIGNNTVDTVSYVQVQMTSGSNFALMKVYNQSFTTSGFQVQSGLAFDVTGAGGMSIVAEHASGTIRFYSGGTTLRAQINANGTQVWAPYGAGAANFDASGNITSVSDVRFKDRIAPLAYGLAEVLQLNPVQHGYNALSELECDHLYGGFLAHEVQALMPIAVGQDARGYLTLADRPILGAVVNGMKELNTRLERLESQLRGY